MYRPEFSKETFVELKMKQKEKRRRIQRQGLAGRFWAHADDFTVLVATPVLLSLADTIYVALL